jgi:hypothetical protein
MNLLSPLQVAAVFGARSKIRPVWFIWQGRKYRIHTVTYTWKQMQGRALFYHFSVTDQSGNHYELCYKTDTATWQLITLEEGY